ncbi:lipid A hydroxylase LpxO [Pigmentiphaga soli]|uniref:Lipid A hydroxylase LpxO n=1 Tax=Pigmentiphaga soli TaxID=1007095 RepID=A0ABP8GYL8_9BURK
MKWVIVALYLGAVVYIHLRGKVRMRFLRQLFDHSSVLAPINAFMYLFSRVPALPYIPNESLPALRALDDNWQVIREEALRLREAQRIRAAQKNDDAGFNSFFKSGWKRFYLKWYDAQHPSAAEWCPRTVQILRGIPQVKAAMFTELPPGAKLNPHRDPFAGSLRYHLGLETPNDDRCFIEVDGQRYSWRDGQSVVFDETYVHWALNGTDQDRVILFCDVERPLRYRWAEAFNAWFGRHAMSAASSPNEEGDKTGLINKLFGIAFVVGRYRRRLKAWNRTVYKIVKFVLIVGVIALIIWW